MMPRFENFKGRTWVFGDNVDTDQIIPGQYLALLDYSEMALHAFENTRPDFVQQVKTGDIIVAGKNFGSGSSREEAPMVLKELGIKVVIAESFSRIFYRNAFNIGIPALVVPTITSQIEEGMNVDINLLSGEVKIVEAGNILRGDKLPDSMLKILRAGGAIPLYLSERKK